MMRGAGGGDAGIAEPAAFVAVEGTPLASAACPWCGTALQGTAAVCNACGAAHHGRCWNGHGGCRTPGCAHTPLPRVVAQVVRRRCVHCGRGIDRNAVACRVCGKAQTPDGRHRGPRPLAKRALSAFFLGLLAWVPYAGTVFGLYAFAHAGTAFEAVHRDPGLGGRWLAGTGVLLAIPGLLLQVLLMLLLLFAWF